MNNGRLGDGNMVLTGRIMSSISGGCRVRCFWILIFPLKRQIPATTVVLRKIPNTLQLAVGAYVFAITMGIPLGIFSAIWRGTLLDLFCERIRIIGPGDAGFLAWYHVDLDFCGAVGLVPTRGEGRFEEFGVAFDNVGLVRSGGVAEVDKIGNVGDS